MQEEVYIKLRFIECELIPEAITDLIGIAPTIAGRKGDLIRGRKLPITEGLWSYKHRIPPPWNVGEALEELLPLIEKNTELQEYCKAFDIEIEFSVIMYLVSNTPIVTLFPSLLRRIADVRASVDFDIYLLGEICKVPPGPVLGEGEVAEQ